MPRTSNTPHHAGSGSTAFLRIEGLLVLGLSVAFYAQSGTSWWVFALLLFAPDLFMLGYLKDPRLGALIYNIGHTYLAPAVLASIGWATQWPLLDPLALIWCAHIGMDRLLGFGLKYPTSFSDSHLSVTHG